jgi:thiol-disulfide isomerase/thioredoxin
MHSSSRLGWRVNISSFLSFMSKQITLLFLVSLVLASCAPMAAEAGLPVGEIMRQESAEAELAQDPTPSDAPTVTAETAAIQVSGGLPPIVLGRAELRASDPTTVTLASGNLQLVEFIAYWCVTCKAIAPTVHGLESLYGDEINFVYLDREDPATFQFQEQLGYIYQPHFFLLDEGGAVIGQWRGYVDGLVLQQALVDAITR